VLDVTPERLRRLATIVTGMLIVIVATGATVRLTASGLGCEHWPGCQPGDPFPKKGYHSYIEFSNRIVAAFTVFGTLALAIGATYTRAGGRGLKTLAWLVFAGTLAQGALGAITVYFDLNPWLVLSHLLLSFVVLGLGVLVVVEATRLVRGGDPALPRPARAAGAVLLGAATVLIVAGTIVTASGPHPGGDDVKRLGRSSLRWTGTCGQPPSSESSSWPSRPGRG
jgi:cytochrome c oxidase assembly protein subunit 15